MNEKITEGLSLEKSVDIKRNISLVNPRVNNLNLIIERLKKVFATGQMTNNGPFLQEFEQQLTFKIGSPCTALSDGTQALVLLMKGLGLRGNVIVPSFTFCATIHAIVWAGLKPKFIDIDPETYNLDPEKVKEAIDENTSAILGVHVFGNPCNIDKLQEIATLNNLKLIFDAAHAFGAKYNNIPIGNFGDGETFSTHATKTLITGEGGFVSTKNKPLQNYLKQARNFGFINEKETSFIGINAKMSELHALIGLDSLGNIKTNLEKKKQIVQLYKRLLNEVPGIRFQKVETNSEHGYFFFSILIDSGKYGLNRDQLSEKLNEVGIQTRKYFYLPIHQHSAYSSEYKVDLPVTEMVAKNILCLPAHDQITDEEVVYVCGKIKQLGLKKKI
jgi:dTDP-4-amino-4,6-dideoxygalactose transaminase